MLWGRAPPRPEAKTPRPSTLARISHAIQSEAECSPGGAATRRLEIAAACTPAPSARAPTTNPPHSTARADTQDKLKLFAGVWRGRQPVLCLEQCARTHALWTAVSALAMQGDCVSVVKGLRARLKQDGLYLLQTRCVEHMTHEQQCQHTVCRKTNCPSGSLSALSAAEVPDLVAPPW